MTETHDPYRELERRWKALCASARCRLREVACPNAACSLLCIDLGDAGRPTVAIAAGVHGDEPAGPWALLALAEAGGLDSRFAYRIWPCTNPDGLRAGTRTNAGGVDVNRTFGGRGESAEAKAILGTNRDCAFLLSLDLHEDCDASGFYCYEYGGGEIGRRVIAVLEEEGLAIDPLDTTFGLAGPLDDARCTRERGRLVADAFEEAGLLGGLSYSLALARGAARHALTFETPATAAWETRLTMHGAAVRAAIAALL